MLNKSPFINTKHNISKIILSIMIALIPLVLYGIYKNGIIPFSKGYGNIFDLLKIITIPILGFIIAFAVNLLNKYLKKEENKYLILYGALIGMMIPSSVNYILFIILTFTSLFALSYIPKKINFNKIAFVYLIIIGLLAIFKQLNYQNNYEMTVESAYNLFDIIIGRNVSGLATSSIIISLIGYGALSANNYYKKDIPLYIIGSYLTILLIATMLKGEITILNNLFNGLLFFTSIYVATDSTSSPYTKMGRMFYGIFIGISTFILANFIDLNISILIAILIASSMKTIFDKTYELYLN